MPKSKQQANETVKVKSARVTDHNAETLDIHEFSHRTTTRPKRIEWEDIVAAVEVKEDEFNQDTPWDNCCGYEHETERASRVDGDASEYRGYCWNEGDRQQIVVTVDRKHAESWGWAGTGASKQVQAECNACEIGRTIDQLAKWYANGWNYYGVTCDYFDCHDSIWGVDDYECAAGEMTQEIAANVADQLEEAGHIIENRPEPEKRFSNGYTVSGWRDAMKRNLHSQDWHGDYRRTRR